MEAKRSAKDIISTLPQNIIETILCHLHIRDAVRTSVLSKNWRYSWTRIPKLVFVDDTFDTLTGSDQMSVMEQHLDMQSPGYFYWMFKRCKLLYAMYQVLLMHQGPILQFTLEMVVCDSCFEFDQIILHLSRSNTLTKLKLHFPSGDGEPYELPLSIYSLYRLTDLHLNNCSIKHQPTFSGFGSLTTLWLERVSIHAKTLLHLLSKSPLLKRVTLSRFFFFDDGYITFIELFESLRSIEHLTTANEFMEMCFIEDAAPQKLPISLPHLKYVSLKDICFMVDHGLSFLALLIKSSPNLEKINLQNRQIDAWDQFTERNFVTLEAFSNIWLEQLHELKMEHFANLKNELEFVKLILVKSPVLKKARITLNDDVTKDEEILILRNLLRCPRVSPVVEIIVERLPYD